MNEKTKMKVVWICEVSNSMLRRHLDLKIPVWHKFIRYFLGGSFEKEPSDYAQWNTNALKEFESVDDVDLHVIFIHSAMRKKYQTFTENSINYYAVSKGDTSIVSFIKFHLFRKKQNFNMTHNTIADLVNKIQPAIIHIMGAENPSYSLSIRVLPNNIPIIVQLQTMLHDPIAIQAYPYLKYQKDCEYQVLNRADYIGTSVITFPKIVREHIKKDPVFINTSIMIAEKANLLDQEKQYDFVYFANYISKSLDLVVEAFGIAYNRNSSLTLDIIGGGNNLQIEELNKRLDALCCKDAVTIEGKLPTHDDVISQIRKARFALLPLKIDVVSSTIREAMWNGLPVVTTITSGTPSLNKVRESVLLSPIGDHEALASNMLRLVNEPDLAKRLRHNAAITVDEMFGNNSQRAHKWEEAYRACIENFNNGTPLPENVLNKN